MVKARCYGFIGTLVSQLMCLYVQALTGSCYDRVLGVMILVLSGLRCSVWLDNLVYRLCFSVFVGLGQV